MGVYTMERVQWAIYEAVHGVDLKALAAQMRVTPQVLINKVNPETMGHALTFDQFMLVLECCPHEPVLRALSAHAESAKGVVASADLLGRVLAAVKEGGDMTAAFQQGSADGVWSENDAREFEHQANEALQAIADAIANSWELARRGGRLQRVA